MTVVAGIVAAYMIRSFTGGPDIIVAAAALLGSAHEDATDVATVALDAAMPAGQWKPRGEMIEVVAPRRSRGR